MTTLRIGDRGEAVKRLQIILKHNGLLDSADGQFGILTFAAIRRFQRANMLKDDGVVGEKTWAALTKIAPAEMPAEPKTVHINGLLVPTYRCLPLRALADGREPVVTSPHSLRDPGRAHHWGADLFYAYDPAVDPPMKIGDGGRTKKWWIPEGTHVIAQADGVIKLAGPSKTGFRTWVEHDGGLLTGAFHMTKLFVTQGQTVAMGDSIGIVGDNPADTDPDHLHSELYRGPLGNYPAGTLDPERFWPGAKILPAK